MKKKKFENIYKEWWNEYGACKALYSINPIRAEFITKKINIKNKKILDIGCGGGLLSEYLAEYKANITGIDISDKLIKVAKKHAKNKYKNIKYHTYDIENFVKINKKKFDIIICMETIEHVKNQEKLIKNIKKLLNKNGNIFISSVNKSILSYLYIILIGEFLIKKIPKKIHNYKNFITPFELNKILKKNGLYIKDIKEIKYNPFINYSILSDKININYISHIKCK